MDIIDQKFFALRDQLRRSVLAANSLEASLGIGAVYGLFCSRNFSSFLADEELEEAIFDRYAAELVSDRTPALAIEDRFDWLHVATNTYETGGHTRLLQCLLAIQSRRRERFATVVTHSPSANFEERCIELGGPVFSLSGTLSERVEQLIALGRSATRIMLHIHPEDLGSALAARALRNEGHQVLFLNHADHIFSFGPGAANVVLEVSGFGWQTTAARRSVRAQHFLGIPISENSVEPTSVPNENGTIVSMGNSSKYKPGAGYNFALFLTELLDNVDRSVELIGPDGSESWWAPLIRRHSRRVRFHGPLPFEAANQLLMGASCYVDSFPTTGGTALPQALLAGKPVFGIKLRSSGYSLADALRSRSVEELIQAMIEFFGRGCELPNQGEIRQRVAEEYGPTGTAERLYRAARGEFVQPPPELLDSSNDLDYFYKMWRDDGQIQVPLPAWAPVPRMCRMALVLKMIGDRSIKQPRLRSQIKWLVRPVEPLSNTS